MAKALIVGAGVGGLAAALRLAHAGYQVEVHEKMARPGGRANLFEFEGYRFDTGPTILLMRDIIEETFRAVGRDPADYLEFTRLDPGYQVNFPDGSSLRTRVDLMALRDELEAIEPGSFEQFMAFAGLGAQLYYEARREFVEVNFDRLMDMIRPAKLPAYLRLRVTTSMHRLVGKYFKDPRLRNLFTFNAMYIGMNPYNAPGVYALLPYNDTVEGVHFTKGGMYGLVEAMLKVAQELGVQIQLNHPAERVEVQNGRAVGVRFADGVRNADVVLLNADWPRAQSDLLGRVPSHPLGVIKLQDGPSALNFYWAYQGEIPPGFYAHNIFLGPEFEQNFADVFAGRPHAQPAYYLHIPSLADPSLAPPGGHVLYVLVPESNTDGNIDWSSERNRLREFVQSDLARRGFEVRGKILHEEVVDPPRWQDEFALAKGATFGISHNVFQVGYFRPHNRDDQYQNLYYVGASTHPGAGIPMVLLSARLVVNRILADLSQPQSAPREPLAVS